MNINKKTVINIISIIFIAIILFTVLPSSVMAINPNDYKPGGLTASDTSKFTGLANPILGVIRVIGAVILVIALMVMGIKYMLGSVEEKAEYKKSMIPYLVGVFLLVGITEVLTFIIEIAGSIT